MAKGKGKQPAVGSNKREVAQGLTAAERELWMHVARTVSPIPLRQRVPSGSATADFPAVLPERKADMPTASHGPESKSKAKFPDHSAQKPAMSAPPLANFDKRKSRKLAAGRAGIDARIDLHGMRLDEARAALRQFLLNAQGRGCKTVLVITGKGREDEDFDLPYAHTLDRRPRGVLRRNLPRWLDELDLRPIVLSYTIATQRHGGEGAFYVELRKNSSQSRHV